MIKRIKSLARKHKMVLFPLLAAMAALISGLFFFTQNNQDITEAKKFRDLYLGTVILAEAKNDEDLRVMGDSWQNFADTSSGAPITAKALYNKAWAAIEIFRNTNEVAEYLAARSSLREALRKDPNFFDAKYNLIYLENLAKAKGIQTEEIPVSANDLTPKQPSDEVGQDQSRASSNGNNAKENTQIDWKSKITGGTAPSLSREPPRDIYAIPGMEDFQQLPSSEY